MRVKFIGLCRICLFIKHERLLERSVIVPIKLLSQVDTLWSWKIQYFIYLLYVLVNDAFSSSNALCRIELYDCYWIMNFKGHGKEKLWCNLRLALLFQDLPVRKETPESVSQVSGFKFEAGTARIRSRGVITRPLYWVGKYNSCLSCCVVKARLYATILSH
jgi:hypothetical protein